MEIKNIFSKMDYYLSRVFVPVIPKNGTLLTFLFHGVYLNEQEAGNGSSDPQQAMTLDLYEKFIVYYLHSGYKFISPDEIINGLNIKGKYILITFDDGYYNNLRILPLLKKYNAPALFFVSTNHIADQKCFWWDVVYREEQKNENTKEQIYKVHKFLKEKKTADIEKYIIEKYGNHALVPIYDTDRPLTVEELKGFAKENLVHIGNHTANHEIITNLSNKEFIDEITKSQKFLLDTIGYEPNAFAYPNGNYTESHIETIKKSGFKLGITTIPGRNSLKYMKVNNNMLLIKRFVLFSKDMDKKNLVHNADIHFFSRLFDIVNNYKHLIFKGKIKTLNYAIL